jgi:hypothetical protein
MLTRAQRALMDALPDPVGGDRHEPDVAGAQLDVLDRLENETISFQRVRHGRHVAWSATSLTGEYRAHGDSLAEVVSRLTLQLDPSRRTAARIDRSPASER